MLQQVSAALRSIAIGYLSKKIKSVRRIEQISRRDVVLDIARGRRLPP